MAMTVLLFTNTIYVQSNESIQNAINSAVNGDTIILMGSVYYQSIEVIGKNGVTIKGYDYLLQPPNVNGQQQTFLMKITDSDNIIIENINFSHGYSNLNTTESAAGITITQSDNITFNDCLIQNCQNVNSLNGIGGLAARNSSLSLNNCTVRNNSAQTFGGLSSYTDNEYEVFLNISECSFSGNQGFRVGALKVSVNSLNSINHVIVLNSEFFDNTGYSELNGSGAISMTALGTNYSSNNSTLNIENCTIEQNYGTVGGVDVNTLTVYKLTSNVVNSIVRNNTNVQIPVSEYEGFTTVEYSNIQGGFDGQGNIDEDPLYVNAANHDYHLTVQSPCIDTGHPDNDGDGISCNTDTDDQDPDGTTLDMGCYYFHHDYDIKNFTSGKIHWISFPRLTQQDPTGVEYYEQAYYANSMPGLLQDTAGGYPTIDGFINLDGDQGKYISYSPFSQHFTDYEFDNMLFRHEGYKLEVADGASSTLLCVDGNRLTEFGWDIASFSDEWMGYYIPYPQNIVDAFGDSWQCVEKVWAEDWYYERQNIIRGKTPETPANSTVSKTMEYGKMYIVEMNTSVTDFQWNDSIVSEIPIEQATPQSFTYTEQSDYEAIDVLDIPAGVTEIGVFEGDTCVGAVVVDETDEQILAYTTQANRNLESLTFQYVTGRGSAEVIDSYLVWDNRRNDFVSGEIMPGRHGYSIVKFGETVQQHTTPASSLSGCSCYPNPFNPSTRIAFTLAVQKPVTVEVFNLKGQKVKTLSIGTLNAGAHSLVWNGTDEQGNPAASGLYFYRIKTNEQDISGKMLLMK
jgi:flagellar hook assembly protein FlgD